MIRRLLSAFRNLETIGHCVQKSFGRSVDGSHLGTLAEEEERMWEQYIFQGV